MPTLKVDLRRGNTFILGVTSTNFEYAREFAIAWASEFLEFHKQERKNLVGTTEAKFSQQILNYENRLEQAEGVLDNFRKQNNIASVQDAGLSAQLRLDKKKAEYESLKMELQLAKLSTAEALASGAMSSGTSETSNANATGSGTGGLGTDNVFSRISAGSRYSELRSAIHNLERQITERSAKLVNQLHKIKRESRKQLRRIKREGGDVLSATKSLCGLYVLIMIYLKLLEKKRMKRRRFKSVSDFYEIHINMLKIY